MSFDKVKLFIEKLKSGTMGYLILKSRLFVYKRFNFGLRWVFRFDRWHLVTFYERPYAIDIVKYANERSSRSSALEIGSGLGDILRRLDYASKVALDNDKKVLSALVFITRLQNFGVNRVKVAVFDFLAEKAIGSYDVIIMCNWIHNISPLVLKEKVDSLVQSNLKIGGELVFDVVDNESYQFNHSVESLQRDLPVKVKVLGRYEYGRQVLSFTRLS